MLRAEVGQNWLLCGIAFLYRILNRDRAALIQLFSFLKMNEMDRIVKEKQPTSAKKASPDAPCDVG